MGNAGGNRQRLHVEAVALLGSRAHDIVGLLLAAQAPASLDGPCRPKGKGRKEVGGILAPLGETEEPLPAKGHCLGDAVGLPDGASQVTEVKATVMLNS